MHGTSRLTTRCPVIRTERGPWSRWTDLSGGLRIMGRTTFEATVEWVRETSATVRTLDADGGQVAKGPTHSDHYGLATSPEELVDEARSRALRLDLGAGSKASVVVELTIEDAPLVPDASEERAYGGRPYLSCPSDWMRADDPWIAAREAATAAGIAPPVEPAPAYLRPVRPAPLTVWTTRAPDGSPEAEALLDAAWAAVAAGLPTADAAVAAAAARFAAWRAAGLTTP